MALETQKACSAEVHARVLESKSIARELRSHQTLNNSQPRHEPTLRHLLPQKTPSSRRYLFGKGHVRNCRNMLLKRLSERTHLEFQSNYIYTSENGCTYTPFLQGSCPIFCSQVQADVFQVRVDPKRSTTFRHHALPRAARSP